MPTTPSLLLLSSSRTGNSGYLEMALPLITQFLGEKELTIAFIPFAAVDGDYEAYTSKVREALPAQYHIVTVTQHNAVDTINTADVIMTGGGNTFKLLHDLYQTAAIAAIKQKINSGTPYIGWSAGSNIAGYSICTTNDMPIIEPASFTALHFLPFQINPHYYNFSIPGFNGETRDQRLEEFLILNPNIPVVALPEGTALLLQNEQLFLKGGAAFVLTYENGALLKTAVADGSALTYLL
jgi:dipeptidase E